LKNILQLTNKYRPIIGMPIQNGRPCRQSQKNNRLQIGSNMDFMLVSTKLVNRPIIFFYNDKCPGENRALPESWLSDSQAYPYALYFQKCEYVLNREGGIV